MQGGRQFQAQEACTVGFEIAPEPGVNMGPEEAAWWGWNLEKFLDYCRTTGSRTFGQPKPFLTRFCTPSPVHPHRVDQVRQASRRLRARNRELALGNEQDPAVGSWYRLLGEVSR
ncbi:MAG: hypothetical protein RMJ60_01620 [Anaerolineales bacterium]|nr:hypothetical protein [Anaerolineales bacterium]